MAKKWIADYEHYMATVGSWELKPTIEEKLAAWRVEEELERHARRGESWLALPKGPKPGP
jgi:hypothetical protein